MTTSEDLHPATARALFDQVAQWNTDHPRQRVIIPQGLRDRITDALLEVARNQLLLVVDTAAGIRRLAEAVAESPAGNPQAVLLGNCGLLWTLRPVYAGDPGELPEVWMVDEARQCRWRADHVTDDGIAGYGPWTVLLEADPGGDDDGPSVDDEAAEYYLRLDEIHPPEPRHWLVIRELDTDPVIEHSGCPSKVTIYSPGEAGPAYRSPRAVAVTEHLCHVGAWLAHDGLDSIDQDIRTIPPGRYEIEAWAEHVPATPDWPEDWDGGIQILDPIKPPSPDRSYLYCDHGGGTADDCTACQDPADNGPDWPIPDSRPTDPEDQS